MEGVGRNVLNSKTAERTFVALLVEGVGRNFVPCRLLWDHWEVALLVEGVGRNQFAVPWELLPLGCLLTEGVDRNMYTL